MRGHVSPEADDEHFASEAELEAMYRTIYGERAKEMMRPESVAARASRAKRRRLQGCGKFWVDTYGL